MPETLIRDVRHSLRALSRSPAFALAAVAALALGIGVNTAIFSVVNAVLLRPLAFPDADRLVFFMSTSPQGSGTAGLAGQVRALPRAGRTSSRPCRRSTPGSSTTPAATFPEQMPFGRVSPGVLRPVRGAHAASAARSRPRRTGPAARRWPCSAAVCGPRRFGSDPDVLGKAISLGGEPYTSWASSGGFDFADLGADPQVWLPFQLDPNTSDQGHYFRAAGRLKAGVSLEQAQAQVKASTSRVSSGSFPGALGDPKNGFNVQPIGEVLVRAFAPVAAGPGGRGRLRAADRLRQRGEPAPGARHRPQARGGHPRRARRLAAADRPPGADRERGAVAGRRRARAASSGIVGIRALLAVNTAGLPRIGENGCAGAARRRVLGFTLAVSVATGLLFGLIPALQSSRADLASDAQGERPAAPGSGGLRQNKTRAVLVVSEVALALTLLVGSALLIRTAVALGRVEPGFDARQRADHADVA